MLFSEIGNLFFISQKPSDSLVLYRFVFLLSKEFLPFVDSVLHRMLADSSPNFSMRPHRNIPKTS